MKRQAKACLFHFYEPIPLKLNLKLMVSTNSLEAIPSAITDREYKDALFRIHIPTHSSDEDKVKAIELLANIPTNDAMVALESALLMIKIPVNNITDSKYEGPGKISLAAARALAKNMNYRCIETILEILRNQTSHPILRQSCLHGLAGVNKHAALEALITCLNDIKPDIRLTALQSIKITLDTCADLSPYYHNLLIESLLFYFFYNFDRNLKISKAEQTLAQYLISKYAHTESINMLKSVLTHEEDEQVCLHALDIYLCVKDEKSEEFLTDLVLMQDRPPSLYSAIAALLSNSKSGEIKYKLGTLASKPYWMNKLIALAMPAFGEIMIERHRAAKKILGQL